MNSGGTFSLSPQAEDDLLRIAAYVGRTQREKTVEFLRADRTTIDFLADSPFAGSLQPFEEEHLHSLRRFRVSGLKNYFIWYRPFASSNGVNVWRVLHASQDVLPKLEEVTS